MARNPFDFLDSGSRERTLLILLLALIRKGGGELELSLQELTAINEGDSFIKYPGDQGASLVLRFARKGAEAYFLSETVTSAAGPHPTQARSSLPVRTMPQSETLPSNSPTPAPPPQQPPRHAVHDDLDYALREEEMAQRAQEAAKLRRQDARARSGALPWRTVPRTQ